ncbi:hypothetical protein WJX73_008013 [Symbiochloris irregularis]|uniref:Uncharacterized protein n=1 Tax=Symbiochloris irregularis TaxID=706552 RepID=A0AAW1PBH5_9CHLO
MLKLAFAGAMSSRPSYHAEGSPSERLKTLKLRLPEPPKAASPFYVPCTVVGDLMYISGQLPNAEDGSLLTGKVIHSTNVASEHFVPIDAGKRAARACALNILSLLQKELGSLDNVARIVKLFIMVNCSNEFKEPHVVANSCSDVFIQFDQHDHPQCAVASEQLEAIRDAELPEWKVTTQLNFTRQGASARARTYAFFQAKSI